MKRKLANPAADVPWCIVVHAGAGQHSRAREGKYCAMMQLACEAGRAALLSGGSTAAVEAAVAVLEDDPAANAGLGSNLTVEGTVECDASIMEGAERTFGACGAVAGVRNPIALAARVLRQQQGHVLSLGRVHPVMLVSEGARRWAEAHDVPVCPATALVTPEARARWEGYRRSLCLSDQGDQGEGEAGVAPAVSDGTGQAGELDTFNDTVGALCCLGGALSAGVSSGGVWLKSCGRVGEAAVFGAGCWAQDGGARRNPNPNPNPDPIPIPNPNPNPNPDPNQVTSGGSCLDAAAMEVSVSAGGTEVCRNSARVRV
jgi:taspase (threonine aspartase 1)